ncbi:MAG: hypothetical protein U0995_08825 [Erythrobacter sp.]|nr:hypothetical protein [Erythrobacter sp.]MDZ4135448.1 hypothetical protein [Paracoccaceae bacterium]MDZ4272980.1 hypothetical protein [Erythrobacter sp.]MDZ4276128.1 hypothetical protein [Erythrobacter sp.]
MSATQSGFNRTIATAIVPGGPIGNFKVPAIRAGDTLLSVVSVTNANPPVPTNRTANASIPAGTSETVAIAAVDTTGAWLVVTWAKAQ